MLEHESFGSQSSIASRGSSTIISLGDDGTNEELTSSFLLKRMEISFAGLAGIITDDLPANVQTGLYYLILHKTSVNNAVDTIAEQFDARATDRDAHQQIIWVRQFVVRTHITDDADNVSFTGLDAVFNTSKSFSKGFRLDKDETYVWAVFNPSAIALTAMGSVSLRVRYWGVNIG